MRIVVRRQGPDFVLLDGPAPRAGIVVTIRGEQHMVAGTSPLPPRAELDAERPRDLLLVQMALEIESLRARITALGG